MKIGIDAGGTLLKIAYITGDERRLEKRPSTDIDSLIDELNTSHRDDDIYLTGGKAEYMSSRLTIPAVLSIEFDATFRGLKLLMKEQGFKFNKFVYLNVGTGTSFHQADSDGQRRAGGSGVGGGTLMGLSRLLTGVENFDDIISLAKNGNRDQIDLKVHHIYAGNKSPLPGDLTASNFGNVQPGDHKDANIEDQLQSVIALVAETVSTIGISLAEGFNTEHIVYIGSTLLDNDVMTEIINRYVRLKGMRPHIIVDGEFSGAVGAAM
ncbi:type II pantothenate kinase [Corticicoccus populi]|uniref:Type II pantothenate kinase n=1 Tax=Corticicoccus populi TaxID=1812821 RepID=A0ABW5WW71_9STAP